MLQNYCIQDMFLLIFFYKFIYQNQLKMIETSTETQQNDQFEKEKIYLNKYIQKCPVTLFINRRQNNIFFSWDCKTIKVNNSFFHRHIIFIHTHTFLQGQIIEILLTYYKYLKLGDFMKIILIGDKKDKNRYDWIQKTSGKISFDKLFSKKINLVKSNYENAFQLIQNQTEPTLLSVFTKNKKNFQQQQQLQFLCTKQRHKFQYIINFFFYEEVQYNYIQQNGYQNYPFYNVLDLKHQIKVSSIELSKVRLIKSQIKLTCNNCNLDLRKFADNRWTLQQNILTLTQYALKNNMQYNETLLLNLDHNILIFFQVEFSIITINKEEFLMNKKISINRIKKQSTENYDTLPKYANLLPLRMIEYSMMNQSRRNPMKGDKVIVRQRNSHKDSQDL